MQLVLGPTKEKREPLQAGWRVLREVDPDLTQIFEIQISLIVAAVVLLGWLLAVPDVGFALEPVTFVLVCAVLALLHESAHAAAFPRGSASEATIVCFRPAQLTLCAHWNGAWSRRRYVAMLATPIAVLSLVPIAASAAFGDVPNVVASLSLLNALVSGGDVLAIVLVLWQVPAGAAIRADGERILWRA